MAYDNLEKEEAYIASLKEYFIKSVTKAFPEARFNGLSGDMEHSTYTLVNVRLPISQEKALMLLFHLI